MCVEIKKEKVVILNNSSGRHQAPVLHGRCGEPADCLPVRGHPGGGGGLPGGHQQRSQLRGGTQPLQGRRVWGGRVCNKKNNQFYSRDIVSIVLIGLLHRRFRIFPFFPLFYSFIVLKVIRLCLGKGIKWYSYILLFSCIIWQSWL